MLRRSGPARLWDREPAASFLEALPLGQAGMMAFELIPLGPLKPLAVLLGETS